MFLNFEVYFCVWICHPVGYYNKDINTFVGVFVYNIHSRVFYLIRIAQEQWTCSRQSTLNSDGPWGGGAAGQTILPSRDTWRGYKVAVQIV